MNFIARIFDVLATSKAKKTSWKEHLLPTYRRHRTVKAHFAAPGNTRAERRANRAKTIKFDTRGGNANWNGVYDVDVNAPGCEHMKVHLPPSTIHHATEHHPECFPKDAIATIKNPDKVTSGFEGGHNAKFKGPGEYRVNFYKQVDQHTDKSPCHMKVVTKPIRHNDGKVHLHAGTYHSVETPNHPAETSVDVGKVNEAADHNKNRNVTG